MFKYDHDAKTFSDAIVDHTIDNQKVMGIVKEMLNNPEKILGSKKSETMESIQKHSNDPEFLLALTLILMEGVSAIAMMSLIKAKSQEAMAAMEIDPKMPEGLKEAIREAKSSVKGVEVKPLPQEDIDDEFEKLKRRYS